MYGIINATVGLIIFIIILFNINTRINSIDIQKLNIVALKTSAVKAWCDPVTSNYCAIRLGGILAEGTGQPRAQY